MAEPTPAPPSEPDDGELLRRYVGARSEPAFAALVQRHLGLVYQVALRKVGSDNHLAEDVAQRVFTALAAKAVSLQHHQALTGWLFTATHYAAAQLVRSERRRKDREHKAFAMNDLENDPGPQWERIRPLLDEVVLKLPDGDREAVLLRYFEGRPFHEVGARLHLSEDGARARVDRAVEKLRLLLAGRGVRSTGAALGVALAQQAGAAPIPAALAAKVTGAALTATATGAAVTTASIAFMSTAKTATVVAAVAVVGVLGLIYGLHLDRKSTEARLEAASVGEWQKGTTALPRPVTASGPTPSSTPPPGVPKDAPANPPAVRIPVTKTDVPAAKASRPADTNSVSREAIKTALSAIDMSGGRDVDLSKAQIAHIHAWLDEDPAGLVQWISTLPEPKRREHAIEALIAIETPRSADLPLMLSKGIERDTARRNRQREIVMDWVKRDPAAALKAIDAANLPESERKSLASTADLFARAAASKAAR